MTTINWYCPTYDCRMTQRSCQLRKKYAQDGRGSHENVFRNAGCATCEKGEPIEVKEPTKPCRICGIMKPLTDFGKNKDCKDGHEGTCLKCKRKRTIENAAKLVIAPGSERVCKKCGMTKKIEEFGKNADRPGGRESTCKSCKNAMSRETEKNKKEAQKMTTEQSPYRVTETLPPVTTCHDTDAQPVVTIDFRDYPEIYNEVVKIAKDEVRTVGCQIIWSLKQTVRR